MHVAIVLSLGFGTLAGGAGYWGVVRAPDLVRSPYDPAVIAAARTVPRGRIVDRDGKVLARNEKDANGEYYRVYAGNAISQVVGYASVRYGRAGLERTYDAELRGSRGRPGVGRRSASSGRRRTTRRTSRCRSRTTSSEAAVRALGDSTGAVVMLDPAHGRDPRARLDADLRRVGDRGPDDRRRRPSRRLRDDKSQPLLPRATLGRYVPGSVFKIVTAIAGLGSGAITPDTTYEEQPTAEKKGLLVDGFRVRDGHHPRDRVDRRSTSRRRPRSRATSGTR